MPLSAGSRLGPYEIVSLIGAGGMGEVYKARDPRLGRDVAIKILHQTVSGEPDRLQRFEQEARAAGLLNHPNILAIYDIGTENGAPYIVSELLEGSTLRDLMTPQGMAQRKAIDYALQVANGLAAAHQKGIIHRDLKPENVFITRDGRAKILDFGLAKLTKRSAGPAVDRDAEATGAFTTGAGVIMGTPGYMSPEQVRGEEANVSWDIFAFGCVLYEMLTGNRAFHAASSVETLHAILRDDPPEIEQLKPTLPAGLGRILKHCLEKQADGRFHSIRDVAFALDAMSGTPSQIQAPVALPPRRRNWLQLGGAAVALAVIAGGAFIGGKFSAKPAPVTYQQLTFRRGYIRAAQFSTDGHSVVYGGAWDGKPMQLFLTRMESPESKSLDLPSADIFSISPTGEMAICLGRRFVWGNVSRGQLAQTTMLGGAPRPLLDDVMDADWSPDGSTLAVVRRNGAETRVEYPIGTVLCRTTGWFSHLRVSPKGERVAFLDHPVYGDDRGSVAVVDRAGGKKTLTREWGSTQGLAWSPDGDEVWFSEEDSRGAQIVAVTLSGRERVIAADAGRFMLQDISRTGQALITHEAQRCELRATLPDGSGERNLSWLNLSVVTSLSADGKNILFNEFAESPGYNVYTRSTEFSDPARPSPAVQIGDGLAMSLSPDGKWALSVRLAAPQELHMLPTGAGEARTLPSGPITAYQWVDWMPDGKRVLIAASEKSGGSALYEQPVDGGMPRALGAKGVTVNGHTIAPDGKFVIAKGADQQLAIYPLDGSAPRLLRGAHPDDVAIQISADARALFLTQYGELPTRIWRLDLATGERKLWKELTPPDSSGVQSVYSIAMTPDARAYAYSYYRTLCDLQLVNGWQ